MMRAIVEAAMTVSLIEGLCIALNSRVKTKIDQRSEKKQQQQQCMEQMRSSVVV
jgi:hypothetical protein